MSDDKVKDYPDVVGGPSTPSGVHDICTECHALLPTRWNYTKSIQDDFDKRAHEEWHRKTNEILTNLTSVIDALKIVTGGQK